MSLVLNVLQQFLMTDLWTVKAKTDFQKNKLIIVFTLIVLFSIPCYGISYDKCVSQWVKERKEYYKNVSSFT